MKEYKRWTDKNWRDFDCSEMYKAFAELEDKIENGTLIKLPCKIGDIVYQVCEKPNTNPFVKTKKEFFIMEHKIGDIRITMIGTKPIFRIATFNNDLGVMIWGGEHINTYLLLTEAEAKLRKLEFEKRVDCGNASIVED